MTKCDHSNAKFEIVIERWCDAYLQTSEICDLVSVMRDVPFAIKVQVVCPDCNFRRRYSAYNTTICAEDGRFGGSAADRWPAWLLNRLIPLRTQNAAVQEACLACGVQPSKHASW
jgi:hypothetical protein